VAIGGLHVNDERRCAGAARCSQDAGAHGQRRHCVPCDG